MKELVFDFDELVKVLNWFLLISICVCALLLAILKFYGSRPPKVFDFELSEISDGVYAYRETVVSDVPLNNYTMATVCDKTGNMLTVKGAVKIIIEDEQPPHAVWEDYNIVYGDVITIYAPKGAVEYMGTVSTARRR